MDSSNEKWAWDDSDVFKCFGHLFPHDEKQNIIQNKIPLVIYNSLECKEEKKQEINKQVKSINILPEDDEIYVTKSCPNCNIISRVREHAMKCHKCKHCRSCKKDLKSGGGRHRLCLICKKNCYDKRDGRSACQMCYSIGAIKKMKNSEMTHQYK